MSFPYFGLFKKNMKHRILETFPVGEGTLVKYWNLGNVNKTTKS